MKKTLFLALLMSLPSVIWADQITTGISKVWDVDSARQEAFRDARQYVDASQFAPTDPNLISNRIATNKGETTFRLPDGSVRHITYFRENKAYSVTTYPANYGQTDYEPLTYYYLLTGELYAFEISVNGGYPNKSYKYCYGEFCDSVGIRSGQLARVIISVSEDDDYVFNARGALTNHWIGDRCFYPDGSSCGTRETLGEKVGDR